MIFFPSFTQYPNDPSTSFHDHDVFCGAPTFHCFSKPDNLTGLTNYALPAQQEGFSVAISTGGNLKLQEGICCHPNHTLQPILLLSQNTASFWV